MVMAQQSSETFDSLAPVLAYCEEQHFTGLLQVEIGEGMGEVQLVSGFVDTATLGDRQHHEALARLRSSPVLSLSAQAILPSVNARTKRGLLPKGTLGMMRPVELMRFCEKNGISCSLVVRVSGEELKMTYDRGDLKSLEPESAMNTELLEACEGEYRIELPQLNSLTQFVSTAGTPKSDKSPVAAATPRVASLPAATREVAPVKVAPVKVAPAEVAPAEVAPVKVASAGAVVPKPAPAFAAPKPAAQAAVVPKPMAAKPTAAQRLAPEKLSAKGSASPGGVRAPAPAARSSAAISRANSPTATRPAAVSPQAASPQAASPAARPAAQATSRRVEAAVKAPASPVVSPSGGLGSPLPPRKMPAPAVAPTAAPAPAAAQPHQTESEAPGSAPAISLEPAAPEEDVESARQNVAPRKATPRKVAPRKATPVKVAPPEATQADSPIQAVASPISEPPVHEQAKPRQAATHQAKPANLQPAPGARQAPQEAAQQAMAAPIAPRRMYSRVYLLLALLVGAVAVTLWRTYR